VEAPRATSAKPGPAGPRKSRVAIPLLVVIIVLAAILLAPRMLNRFSQLQPHADTVEPTIVPAASALGPPTAAKPAAKLKPPKQELNSGNTGAASTGKSEEKRVIEKETPREQNSAATRAAVSANEASNRAAGGSVSRAEEGPENRSSKPAKTKVTRGAVQYQVVPDISPRARESIQGTVRVNVKVHVDADGHVSNAELTNGSNRFFGDQAVEVARRWIFTPPQVDGRNAPSEWQLRFEFSHAATKVFPTQSNP
jgi:TonB family protein